MTKKRFSFPDTVPLREDERGAVRVTGSRITLDTIVGRYHVGDTIEEIHEGFPTVSINQINAIIGWYLSNQVEADEYLREGEAEAEKLRLEIESRPENIAWHEKMRSLREQLNKAKI